MEIQVLDKVIDCTTGLPVNKDNYLLERLSHDPTIKGILMAGEPGSGKTTFLGDLVNGVLLEHGLTLPITGKDLLRFWPATLPFDRVMELVAQAIRDSRGAIPRSKWGDKEMDYLSDVLTREAQHTLTLVEKRRDQGYKTSFFMDTVGVGKLNRGKTTLRELASDNRLLVFIMAAEPQVKSRAVTIRQQTNIVLRDALTELESRYGSRIRLVDLAGVAKNHRQFLTDLLSPHIKRIFTDNNITSDDLDPWQTILALSRMGSEKVIKTIHQEVLGEALDWVREEEISRLGEIEAVQEILPASTRLLSPALQFELQLRIAYFKNLLGKLGVTPDRGAVLLDPFQESIVWSQAIYNRFSL